MKFAINRTDAISWSISAALILLLNTNLKTGAVNWTWTLLIFASALTISRIQEYLMPLLMRRAANWPHCLCNSLPYSPLPNHSLTRILR